ALLGIGERPGESVPAGEPGGVGSAEWRGTLNSQAAIAADRPAVRPSWASGWWGTPNPWVQKADADNQDWEGGVMWNDGHATYEPDGWLDTRYGDVSNPEDHLYSAADADAELSAWMRYTEGDRPTDAEYQW
ncbi:MAG: hypothetical protein WD534_12185, partial [Phycisphaeraceae bacterium]